MYQYLYDAMYGFFYILWCVLYAIATDPGTIVEVQGLGFSTPKIRGVTTARWICVFPGKIPQNDRDDRHTRLHLQVLLWTHNLLQLLFLHVSVNGAWNIYSVHVVAWFFYSRGWTMQSFYTFLFLCCIQCPWDDFKCLVSASDTKISQQTSEH
jgi:hypothetical protein